MNTGTDDAARDIAGDTAVTTGVGYLTVRVTTARGAIPVEGASVTLRGTKPEESGVMAVYLSGRDGLTQAIPMPAPPRKNSESPNGGEAYYTYNVEIVKEGYYSQFYYNIPAFDGISALQTAELIPLPVNGIPDRFTQDNSRFFERENADL